MIILGIDPGTLNTGYGIVSYSNNKLSYISSGIIKLHSNLSLAERLEIIYNEIIKVIAVNQPEYFSIETAFFGKNVQSAMKIGYARGVSILAAVHKSLKIFEYSPREVKKSVVGNGAASKEQVQFMVQKLLNLPKEKIQFDETDALAVAICSALKGSSHNGNKSASWKNYLKQNPDKVRE